MVACVDRDAIARAQRRRQAEEALEVERDRMAMLEGQIEDMVTELLGAGIDEAAFAAMTPEEVEAVRELLDPPSDFDFDDDEPEEESDEGWDETPGAEPAAEPEEDPAAETEAEISRLEAEIAISRQRQQALERYIEALGG